jgi:hypothetical protein
VVPHTFFSAWCRDCTGYAVAGIVAFATGVPATYVRHACCMTGYVLCCVFISQVLKAVCEAPNKQPTATSARLTKGLEPVLTNQIVLLRYYTARAVSAGFVVIMRHRRAQTSATLVAETKLAMARAAAQDAEDAAAADAEEQRLQQQAYDDDVRAQTLRDEEEDTKRKSAEVKEEQDRERSNRKDYRAITKQAIRQGMHRCCDGMFQPPCALRLVVHYVVGSRQHAFGGRSQGQRGCIY